MLGDILIAAGIAFTQLAITWYGVHVSVQEKRLRNAFIIGIVGAIGVGLTIWGAIRSGTAQKALQAELDQIKTNTEHPPNISVTVPPPIVNLPPNPHHAHLEYESVPILANTLRLQPGLFPFREAPMMIPLGFKNASDFAVNRPADAGLVVLVPAGKLQTAFREARKKLKFFDPGGSIPAHSTYSAYHTYQGPALTSKDIGKLINGDLDYCVFGAVRWSDETGEYETDAAQCAIAEPPHGPTSFNWHALGENNEETKLK